MSAPRAGPEPSPDPVPLSRARPEPAASLQADPPSTHRTCGRGLCRGARAVSKPGEAVAAPWPCRLHVKKVPGASRVPPPRTSWDPRAGLFSEPPLLPPDPGPGRRPHRESCSLNRTEQSSRLPPSRMSPLGPGPLSPAHLALISAPEDLKPARKERHLLPTDTLISGAREPVCATRCSQQLFPGGSSLRCSGVRSASGPPCTAGVRAPRVTSQVRGDKSRPSGSSRGVPASHR